MGGQMNSVKVRVKGDNGMITVRPEDTLIITSGNVDETVRKLFC